MHQLSISEEHFSAIFAFLSGLELFQTIEKEGLKEFTREFSIVSLAGGETLIEQEESDNCLYILYQGRLAVFCDGKEIAEISVGETVGEIALLTESPRTATVRAIRDSLVLKLNREAFLDFEEKYPHSVVAFAKSSIKRLITKKRATEPGEKIVTIAVAPAGFSHRRQHRSSIEYLHQALNRIKPTLLVNKAYVNAHFGYDIAETKFTEVDHVKLNHWLNSIEDDWDCVLFETDSELTPWTQRVLRHADRVFLIAEDNANPACNAIEHFLFNEKTLFSLDAIDIAFMHVERKAVNTHLWLNERPPWHFHHLQINSKPDFERMIRFVTGTALGVVLNGGGIRGFAHVGVLKALDEMQIPIDFIGGTSAGAVTAAFYAKGGVELSLAASRANDFAKMGKDYTLPTISLLSGKNISRIYQKYLEDIRIEDLWTRFFCVSTDLTDRQLHIHTQGLLWRALRATTAVPGIFPPLFDERGHMLVDGAVIDNMPVDVMRTMLNGGKVLAVNCFAKVPFQIISMKEYWVSGWRLLLKRFSQNKLTGRYPSIFDVLRDSFALASLTHQKKMAQSADFFLEIDTSKYSVTGHKKRLELIDLGYQIAIEKLPNFLKNYATTST